MLTDKFQMSKFLESLVNDAMHRIKTPEVQQALHSTLFAPLVWHVMEVLHPYLIAIVGLWAMMFLGILIILVMLLRGRGIQ